MIAEPLENGLAVDIESGEVRLEIPIVQVVNAVSLVILAPPEARSVAPCGRCSDLSFVYM